MKYVLALSLLLFPAVAPISSATTGHLRIYEDGSYVRYIGNMESGTGCLPLRLCQ